MALVSDLRYALRTLRRSPGYALTCLAVLAPGIGANAAIFSVVHAVVLKPLPYPEPDRLVFVWQHFPNLDLLGGRMQAARRNFLEWKRQNTVFSQMAAFQPQSLEETGADHPRQIQVAYASADLFPMLGVTARMGRLFTSAEERPGNNRVAVVSDSFFQQRFHGDREAALGKSMTLGGVSCTLIGVLPPKFHVPSTREGMDQTKADLWLPVSLRGTAADDEARLEWFVAARLKPGISLAQARAEMAGIAARLAKSDPKLNEGWTTLVFPFAVEDAAPKLHRALLVLLGAVGFLLLIACANLANLTLARATMRSREIAVRLALGATRLRIVRQLVTESFLVSMGGAVCGLLLAQWAIPVMLAFQPPDIQRPELIEINLPVFAFAAAASVLTTILFGVAPSLAASRTDLNTALKSGAWGASAARVRSRQFLIVAEVALALVMLVGAGLMLRSFQQLIATGIGFQTTHLITADVTLPAKRYPDGASQSRALREILAHARAIPSVVDVALVDNLPLHSVSVSNFYIAGRPDPPINALPTADKAHASPGYFQAIGLRLVAGRFFTDADRAFTEKDEGGVAIVNQAFARIFFPGTNPLGQHLLSPDKAHSSEIVGLVADYRPLGVENGPRPEIFWPDLRLSHASLLVRTSGTPLSLASAVQNAVWAVERGIPIDEVRPMDHYVDEWQAQRKFNTWLLAIFAGLALVLAMIGIYGVLANLVASRIREIGIRLAIGARPAEIARLILRQSMIPVAIGLAAGLCASLLVGRFLEALLFQVHARDPLTLGLSAATILLLSPLAVWIPLRRAMRVECTVALREE